MPATNIETVGIDLEGNFKSKAEEDARAALQAAAALEKLGLAATGIKAPDFEGTKAAAKGAAAAAEDAAAQLNAAKEAAAHFRAEADKAFAVGNRRRGEALEKSAEALDPIFEETKEAGGFFADKLKDGGDWLKASAKAAAIAIPGALIGGGVALAKEIAAIGVEQTAAREKQTRILDKLTQGNGDLAYRVTLSLAGEKGVEPEEAAARVKGLIQAKFNQSDTQLLFRAAADLGEVKGADKAKTFLEQLEKTGNKGLANEESLNGLAEAGVEAAAVLDLLRRKGESVDAVRARLKAGQVGVREFAQAAGKAVESSLGGVAGQGLDASLDRVKILASQLFDGMDLTPIRDALNTIEDLLKSPAGKELKAGITELGQSVIDLLKPLQTENGKKALADMFDAAATSAKAVAAVVRELKNELQVVVNWVETPGAAGRDIKGAISRAFGGRTAASPEEQLVEAQVAEAQRKRAEEDARKAGLDVAKGFAEGVKSGAPIVNEAVKSTLGGGVDVGKKELEIHSPSKVFGDMGRNSALGYAKGANDNAGVASDAAANMARGAIAAARSSGPGMGAASAGAAPGASITIHLGGVTVVAAPGTSPAAAADQADAMVRALEPRIAAAVRLLQRDLTESGGSLVTRVA